MVTCLSGSSPRRKEATMPSDFTPIVVATIIASGIILGCKLLAAALDDLRRMLSSMTIVVNHRTFADKEGGVE